MSIKSILKEIFAKEDLRSDDKLGVYPEKVHVPAFLERRYLKTSRMLALITIISMCINIIMGSFLFMTPSMVKSEPRGYAYNPEFGGFLRLEDMYTIKSAENFVFEEQLREYVYLRHKVIPDIDIMTKRWAEGSRLYWMSGSNIYDEFKNSEYNRIVDLIKSTGYRQDVYFRWSRMIRPFVWCVEFDTYEYHDWQYKKGRRKRWRVYAIVSRNNNIPYRGIKEYALRNPLNVIVLQYYLSSIPINEEK